VKREFFKIKQNIHETTIICVDSKAIEEILLYIFNETVLIEFNIITGILIENLRNSDLYLKVQDNIFEMRFTRNGRNDRIYCKEIRTVKKRYIIMIELLTGKKTQKIPKKVIEKIKTEISKYEYDI
jgi:hypothetical protein